MPTYNPLDSRFLTTANAITRDGQKFVRIILDTQDNIFYTLDDDGNFEPIGSGGVAGVSSISVGTGLSASSSTGAVTIVNTSPNQSVSISGGTDIEVTGSYPNFGINFTGTTTGNTTIQGITGITGTSGISASTTDYGTTIVNTSPDQTITITGGTDIEITGTYPDFGVNFTGITSGVTGSGVVNTENSVYYFSLWTATTPTASAVTTTELTNSSVYETTDGIGFTKPIYAQQSIVIGVNGYTMPNGAGTAKQILSFDTADPPSLGWQDLSSLLPQNIYGSINGGNYTFTGLTTNQWEIYGGLFVRYIQNNIAVGGSPSSIIINDPTYNNHILMFNVTGEIDATANHAIEIGWAYNDLTPTIIQGSNQVTHLRSGTPVGNFNQTFFAEIFQGTNEFYLFARNITDNTNITLNNINLTITTIYAPLS